MLRCLSSLSRQISLRAEEGTPCKHGKQHLHTHTAKKTPAHIHLVVIVQPDPLQCHDFPGLLVLGLEHRPVGSWPRRRCLAMAFPWQWQPIGTHPRRSSPASRTSAWRGRRLKELAKVSFANQASSAPCVSIVVRGCAAAGCWTVLVLACLTAT